ncbi:MAG: ribonuclease J [Candidatus Colwellbacteria bacterium]|nr:ribonuclease J [Candidatus Colwellbacteria bacterium]
MPIKTRSTRIRVSGTRTASSARAAARKTTKGAAGKAAEKTVSQKMPKKGEERLRIVPLGGLEEIGRNMNYFEYEDEIVIVDMGFQFPEEETPGIDYIIPNIASLEPVKDKIRAVIITHGHLDHIGAIPYLLGRLGNPPLYTLKLTKVLIERRQAEFPNAPKPNIIEVKYGEKKNVGRYFDLEFFGVEHTIPDSMGVILKTPVGNIVHFGDFKLDRDREGNIYQFDEVQRVGRMGVHTFMMDSTNALEEGHNMPEYVVEENIEELLKNAKGRVLITTFSSMLTRIAEFIKMAEKQGRKVAINGRSMRENVDAAKALGYIKFKEGTLIPVQEFNKYKDDKLMLLSTGAQGESNAGLTRIVNGEHRYVQLKKGDTVIFSSSIVPGNERSVQILTDNMARQGAIIHNVKIVDIHSSGHARAGDLKLTIETLKPKYVMPVHGYYYFRFAAGKLAEETGLPEENVKMMDNGQIALLTKDSFEVTKEFVPANYVMVDGLGIGDVEEVVLRDRRMLATDGMIVLIVTLDRRTGRVLKNPDIISRGFIYLRDNQELLRDIRHKVRGIVGRIPKHQSLDADYLKSLFRDQIGQFLFHKTHRRPMVLPVVIEI